MHWLGMQKMKLQSKQKAKDNEEEKMRRYYADAHYHTLLKPMTQKIKILHLILKTKEVLHLLKLLQNMRKWSRKQRF